MPVQIDRLDLSQVGLQHPSSDVDRRGAALRDALRSVRSPMAAAPRLKLDVGRQALRDRVAEDAAINLGALGLALAGRDDARMPGNEQRRNLVAHSRSPARRKPGTLDAVFAAAEAALALHRGA